MLPTSRAVADLDSRTLERRLAARPLLIQPVGALEAHGPHLPLGADQIQAERTAEALAERIDALIAPALPYGCCPGTRQFPGTVSLSNHQLSSLIEEVLGEWGRIGFRRILVLSGHAERGHLAALREGADRARAHLPELRIVVLSDYAFVYELRGKRSPDSDGHGGLLETSRLLAFAPEKVGPARPAVTDRSSPYVAGPPTSEEWPESVIGDTGPASAALGSEVNAHVLARLEATVRELLPT